MSEMLKSAVAKRVSGDNPSPVHAALAAVVAGAAAACSPTGSCGARRPDMARIMGKPNADDVKRVAVAALVAALDDGKDQARKKPGLTGVRAVATGAVLYTAGKAAFSGRRFINERLRGDGRRAARRTRRSTTRTSPRPRRTTTSRTRSPRPRRTRSSRRSPRPRRTRTSRRTRSRGGARRRGGRGLRGGARGAEEDEEEPVAEEDEDFDEDEDEEEPEAEEDEDFEDEDEDAEERSVASEPPRPPGRRTRTTTTDEADLPDRVRAASARPVGRR